MNEIASANNKMLESKNVIKEDIDAKQKKTTMPITLLLRTNNEIKWWWTSWQLRKLSWKVGNWIWRLKSQQRKWKNAAKKAAAEERQRLKAAAGAMLRASARKEWHGLWERHLLILTQRKECKLLLGACAGVAVLGALFATPAAPWVQSSKQLLHQQQPLVVNIQL